MPLDLISNYMHWIIDIELHHLKFVLLDFSLSFVPLLLLCSYSSIVEKECLLCHCALEVGNLLFLVHSDST
jgi:hypothetical protein